MDPTGAASGIRVRQVVLADLPLLAPLFDSTIPHSHPAATLTIHRRRLVLDGVYRRCAEGSPAIREADAPTDGARNAAVRADAHGRKRLEQRCCDMARPASSDGRRRLNAAGQVPLA